MADKGRHRALRQSLVVYDYVRFIYCDLEGKQRSFTVAKRNMSSMLQHGICIYRGILLFYGAFDYIFIVILVKCLII